jgi:RHS repeat-associated protein
MTATETTLYYFGGAYEKTVETGAVRKYYSFAGQTIAMRDEDGLKYFLTDHLGSIVAITGSTGTLISQQRYLPFGGVREDVGSITQTDFSYTGQRSLPETGLMDYRARFYSSGLGRFLQPDSIVPNSFNPQNWNRYSYVTNRPINFNDPTGHMLCNGEFCQENGGGKSGGDKAWVKPPKPKKLKIIVESDDPGQACSGKNQSIMCLPQSEPDPYSPVPQLPLLPSDTMPRWVDSYPESYIIRYETYFDLRKVDWLHVGANGVGIIGDAATIAAFLDPLPVVDELVVGGISTGANAIGIGIDAYDLVTHNDFSGATKDTLLILAEKTNALKRIAPVLGLGAHITGLADAIKPGIVHVPVHVPIR